MKIRTPRSLPAALIATAVLLQAPTVIAADSNGGEWSGDFSIPAFDLHPQACAVFRGQFVVGGPFHFADGVEASSVAAWTGSSWTPLGGGLPAPVRCFAVRGSTLLAGTTPSDPGVAPVMQFDGNSWQPLGVGLYGETNALLVNGVDVFAAGLFHQASSPTAFRVMRWTGTQWTPVGGWFNGVVRALALHNGELYAAGDFFVADGSFVSRIVRWDGTHWVDVGGGTGQGGNGADYIAALASYGGRLIAGGSFTSIGGNAASSIAAWDGAAWSALPNTPVVVWVSGLEVEGAELHVAGYLHLPYQRSAGLATFDGQAWAAPSTYPDGAIDDVATGDGSLIAVGSHWALVDQLTNTRRDTRDVVVRDATWRDLHSWKSTMRGLRGPSSTTVNALHVHDGSLFAAGRFDEAANPPDWEPTSGIARWDGDRWRHFPIDLVGDTYRMTSWNGRLVAGGTWSPSVVRAWSGSSWSYLGSLEGDSRALTAWDGALISAGRLRVPGDPEYSGVMIYRGADWTPLGEALIQDGVEVLDVAVFRGDLYAAVSPLHYVAKAFKSLVRWDGQKWVDVPGTPLTSVACLKTFADGLWVGYGGYGSNSGSSVWRWNGQEWSGVGELTGPVFSLGELDGHPFAGSAGSSYLVRWNGTEWMGVPGAPNYQVLTMASFDGALFVGGDFRAAGGHAAEGMARWVPTPAGPAPKVGPFTLHAGPNPATDRILFHFELAVAGRVRLSIYDLRGALVAKPVDETLPAGTIERYWTPRGHEGARPGIYFAKLVAPEGTSTARIAVVE